MSQNSKNVNGENSSSSSIGNSPNLNSDIPLQEDPFVLTVLPRRLSSTCSYCLKITTKENSVQLLRCSKCKFVHYCNGECQKNDWAHHKKECQRLRRFQSSVDEKGIVRKFPPGLIKEGDEESALNFPDEGLRMVGRLMDIWDRPDTKAFNSNGRTLDMLESHDEEILKDPIAMEHFKNFAAFYEYYCTGDGTGGRPEYDKRKLLKIYSIYRANTFWIKDALIKFVACGIFVNLRRIKHSCRPSARLAFQGRCASVVVFANPNSEGRLIKPTVTSYDQLSYSVVNQLLPKRERRQLLKSLCNIDCRCDCCEFDQERNDAMEGLVCDSASGCDGIVVWQEEEKKYKCRTCGKAYDDQDNAKTIMEMTKGILNDPATQRRAIEEPMWAKEVYANLACAQMPTLHPRNIYRIRTMEASYETAIQLGNWQDAATYGLEILKGYKNYMNEYSDHEYAMMAMNVAKAHIKNFIAGNEANMDQNNSNLKVPLELLENCKRCFEYVYGSESDQYRECQGLIGFCDKIKKQPKKRLPVFEDLSLKDFYGSGPGMAEK